MPPVKPECCVIDGRLAVFMGADYKMLDPLQADAFVRKLQGKLAELKREIKRKKRVSQ